MRHLRFGVAMAVLAGAACGGGTLRVDGGAGTGGGGGMGGAGNRVTGTLPQTVNRNVDILFLIDDSSSMSQEQTNLITNFPTFMTTLQNSPQGMPNLHIAVVSQDMGAGDGSITGCDANGGKRGIFQYTPQLPCTTTNLQQGATFIANVAGQANYTGNLADVFACIARLGSSGCGFEHQFAAILRALGADGSPAPAENANFLRPEAYLAIVLLTNEDDCSASSQAGNFYDVSSNQNIGSLLGPPSNFRCNEFGHLCSLGGGAPMRPSRNAPNNDVNATVNYDTCTSNDAAGTLLGVKDTADRIKALKADPSMITVTSIQGAPTPYQVHWKNPSIADTSCGAASCPWPEITHSCTAADSSFADPGVRTAQLVDEFGANGLVLSICDASYAPALSRIADLINVQIGPPCIPGEISLDPRTGEPDCKITAHNGNVDTNIPACADNGGAAPCWQLAVGGAGCSGQVLEVSLDPNVSASSAGTVSYSCGQCVAGMPDPARGCP